MQLNVTFSEDPQFEAKLGQVSIINEAVGGDSYKLQPKTVTPAASDQQVTPDKGNYGLSSVTVKAIPNTYKDVSGVTAVASDILSGKAIVNSSGVVTGAMPNNGAVTGTISTVNGAYTVPQGYHNGSGKVALAAAEKAKITASNIRQGVTLLGVTGTYGGESTPSDYKDVSGVTATADDVLKGKTIVGSDGEVKTGTIEQMHLASTQLTPNDPTITIPAKSYTGSKASSISVKTKDISITPTSGSEVRNARDYGVFISAVTVDPIPSDYIDAKKAIPAAYTALEAKGATMPTGKTAANLARTIASIPTSETVNTFTVSKDNARVYNAENPTNVNKRRDTLEVTCPCKKPHKLLGHVNIVNPNGIDENTRNRYSTSPVVAAFKVEFGDGNEGTNISVVTERTNSFLQSETSSGISAVWDDAGNKFTLTGPTTLDFPQFTSEYDDYLLTWTFYAW